MSLSTSAGSSLGKLEVELVDNLELEFWLYLAAGIAELIKPKFRGHLIVRKSYSFSEMF